MSQLDSPLGQLLLVTDADQTIRALDFADHRAHLHRGLREHYAAFELVRAPAPGAISGALTRYFAGELGALDALVTEAAGTSLQRQVWAALRTLASREARASA